MTSVEAKNIIDVFKAVSMTKIKVINSIMKIFLDIIINFNIKY